MNETFARRFASLSGLALAAVLAVWWLGSTRIAIDRGADPGRSSTEILQMAWLARAMLVPALTVRAGALRGWRDGAASATALIVPSWPVVALAGSASVVSPWALAFTECLLLAGAIALPAIGLGLRRVVPRADVAEALASMVGVVLAASLTLAYRAWPFVSAGL
ncbi:MAG: hypothetical protein ABI745_12545 [Caldimonas sp.]